MEWTIFDLDDTLLRNYLPKGAADVDENVTLHLYPDTERVLRFLKDRGFPIVLASFRTNAQEALQKFGLLKYFDALRYGQDGQTKVDMINELAHELGYDPRTAVFFDDNRENYKLCNNEFIYTVLVDQQKGVTMEQMFDAITAMLQRPLYILSDQPLNEAEIRARFPDLRVVMISQRLAVNTILRRMEETDPLVLQVTGCWQLDLFTLRQKLSHQSKDFYMSLNTVLGRLTQIED